MNNFKSQGGFDVLTGVLILLAAFSVVFTMLGTAGLLLFRIGHMLFDLCRWAGRLVGLW